MKTYLLNGAILILEVLKPNDGTVVLARSNGAFVTWWKDDKGNCFWGHYFSSSILGLQEATTDLIARVGV